jgi:hypothetical protein
MVATDVANIDSGQTVTLTGYYSAGDFGEPLQLVVEASTGGVKSHTLADGRYANLYSDGFINVKWFGAKGNATDSTATWDDRPYIQSAIDSAYSNYTTTTRQAMVVYFPSGYYNIQTTDTVLDIDGNSIEVGVNFAGDDSLYKTTTTYRDYAITFVGEDTWNYHDQSGTIISAGDQISGVDGLCYFYKGECKQFKNFHIFGNQRTHKGLWVNSGWWSSTGQISHSNFENIYSAYCIQAVLIECCFKTQVKNVRGSLSKRGIDIQPITSLYASQLAVSSYLEAGITIGASGREGGRYSTIEDCVVETAIQPSNHLFGKDANEGPYDRNALFWIANLYTAFPSEVVTKADYDSLTYGAGYTVYPGFAVVNFRNIGTEHMRHSTVAVIETGSGYGTVNLTGVEGDGGGGAYPEWDGTSTSYKGTINDLVNVDVPDADGSSITITTTADYTTKIAVGDIVFIGKRTAGTGTLGSAGAYIGPDDIISDPDADNTLLYGFAMTVTAITASDITGARTSNLTGAEWPTGSDYPAGVGANGEGELTGDEYIWVLVPSDKDVLYYNGTRESVNIVGWQQTGRFWGPNYYENSNDFVTVPAGLTGRISIRNALHRYITDTLDLTLDHIEEEIYPLSSTTLDNLAETKYADRPYLWHDTNATWTVDSMTLTGGLSGIGTSDFTISFVVSLDDWSPTAVQTVPFLLFTSHITGNNRVTVFIESTGSLRMDITDNVGSATTYRVAAGLTDGETYRVTIVADRDGNADFYVGSTLMGSADISGDSAVDIGSGNTNSSDIGRARGTPFRLYEFVVLDYLVTDVANRVLLDAFVTYADLTSGSGEAILALLGSTLDYSASAWTWDDAGPSGNNYAILESETVPAVGGDNSKEIRIVTTTTAWVGQDTVFDQLPPGHYDLAITAVTPGTPDVKVGSASGSTDDIVATVTLGAGSTDLTMLLTESPTGDLLFTTTASTVTFIVSYKL